MNFKSIDAILLSIDHTQDFQKALGCGGVGGCLMIKSNGGRDFTYIDNICKL